MTIPLVSEDEIVGKKKSTTKTAIKKPLDDGKSIPIIDNKKTDSQKVDKDAKQPKVLTEVLGVKSYVVLPKSQEEKVEGETKSTEGGSMIVKRIYFPGETYSNNEKQFKKILAEFKLTWVKSMFKKYSSKSGQFMTGLYSTSGQDKKVFAIYEGSKKPATMILKVAGSGGSFVLNLIQFCHSIGCEVEDKNELYINKILLRLQDYGDINIDEKKSENLSEEEKIAIENKIKVYIDDKVDEFVHTKQDYLLRNNVPFDIARIFKKWDMEKDIKWSIENGLIKL